MAVSLAIGCGGGGGGDSANGAASKSVFLKKANAICRQGSADFSKKAAAVFREAGSAPELAVRRDLVREAIAPMFHSEIRGISGLEAPPGGARQVGAILAAMRRLVIKLEGNPLSRGEYPYRGVEDLAAGYGLSECGHP
ncbi:MAG TPA: hypothetical protein VFZ25_20865 [Chloroflexota bacterium]|nr:hypothetical protein [Chloroflexota bacterium]